MTRHARSGVLGLMAAALTACGSSLGSGGGHGGAGGGGGGGGGQATSGSAGAGGGAGSIGGPAGGTGGGFVGGSVSCSPGVPATTQLRRLKNREYDAVVRDLLGLTSLELAGGAKPPSALLYADFDGPMIPDAWRLYKDVGSGDRDGGHGQPDAEGEVHHLRSGDVGLSDGDDQELRPQGVPPPADRCRGRRASRRSASRLDWNARRRRRGDAARLSAVAFVPHASRADHDAGVRRRRASSSPATKSRRGSPSCSGAPSRMTC